MGNRFDNVTRSLTSNSTITSTTFSTNVAVAGSITTSDGTQFNTANSFGMRNRIINGGFDVWQRATSFASSSGSFNTAYTADRWWMVDDAVGTVNITRQDISTLSMSSIYCIRAERTSGTNRWVVGTQLETIATKDLFGKTVTFSCKIRKGAGLTSDVGVAVATSTTEAKYGSVVDGSAAAITATNASLNTSTFTKFTYTFAIPSSSSALGFKVEFSALQTGATNAYFDIAEVQLEIGSVATPFERRPYGLELLLCQRYYEVQNFSYVTIGYKGGGIFFHITKRAVPTVNFYTGQSLTGTSGSLLETQSSGSAFSVSTYGGTVDGLSNVNTSVAINATMSGSFAASAEL